MVNQHFEGKLGKITEAKPSQNNNPIPHEEAKEISGSDDSTVQELPQEQTSNQEVGQVVQQVEVTEEYHESAEELNQYWMWTNAENAHWKVEALQLASEVSNNNLDFTRKITAENGNMGQSDQSKVVKAGIREPSFGYCQIHRGYHPTVVNDERFFTDSRWQMEQCFRLWKGGTKFYAQSRPVSEFYLKQR